MKDQDQVLPTRLERALRRLEKAVSGADPQIRQLRSAIETCRDRGTLDERRVTEEVLRLESRTSLSVTDINVLSSSLLAIPPQRRRNDKPK